MLYGHAHTDHIGGAGAIKVTFLDVEIIAQGYRQIRFGERESCKDYDLDLFVPIALSQKGSALNFSSKKSINTRIFAER